MLEFSIITITAFVSVLDTTLILIMKNFCKGDFKRFIPVFSILFGIGLGVAGYYTTNVEMGSNLIEAIFIGLSAGAAATGIDQVSKQLTKDDTTSSAIQYLKNFLESIDVPNDTSTDLPDIEDGPSVDTPLEDIIEEANSEEEKTEESEDPTDYIEEE